MFTYFKSHKPYLRKSFPVNGFILSGLSGYTSIELGNAVSCSKNEAFHNAPEFPDVI